MMVDSGKIRCILDTLSRRYPVVKTQLDHQTPFQLLIATILSAQCTDNQVNKVTRHLFGAYPDPVALAGASLADIKKIIFSTGFYNHKAMNIRACAQALLDGHQGRVPENLDELVKLPGVGRKTANVVLSAAFGHSTIVVDTHVLRISNRLGLTEHTNPAGVEQDLMRIIPVASWNDLSLQLIYFGREICRARNPLCPDCPLRRQCLFRPS